VWNPRAGQRVAFCDGHPFERRRIMIEDLDRAVLTREGAKPGRNGKRPVASPMC
jgi:hypothetical protein